jgi:hypothetical protein
MVLFPVSSVKLNRVQSQPEVSIDSPIMPVSRLISWQALFARLSPTLMGACGANGIGKSVELNKILLTSQTIISYDLTKIHTNLV